MRRASTLSDLSRPLNLIAAVAPAALSHYPLHVVRQQLDIFGLHTAGLDIREDSSRLTATMGEILRALNLDTTFEAKRRPGALAPRCCACWLNPSRSWRRIPAITPETSETWASSA